jgi:hypothetical protein
MSISTKIGGWVHALFSSLPVTSGARDKSSGDRKSLPAQ